MSTDAPIDGTAEEMPDTPSTEVAVVQPQAVGAFIAGERPEDIIATAATVANALKGLIDQQDMAKSMGGGRKHVEVGAWQACGMMLGALGGQPLHAETVWTRLVTKPDGSALVTPYEVTHVKKTWGGPKGARVVTQTDEYTYTVDGHDWEACVEIKTPGGVVVGRAEAMCSRSEHTWAKRDDYAVRSMAETRAESRAFRRAIGWVVHMAGYSPTPAEEMGHQPGQAMGEMPDWAQPASPALATKTQAALGWLLGADLGGKVYGKLAADTDGELVGAVGRAIVMTISGYKEAAEAAPSAAPEPTSEPAPEPVQAELGAQPA